MSLSCLTVEGGLLSPEAIELARSGKWGGQRPQDFGLSEGRVESAIASAWESAQRYWAAFQERLRRLPAAESTVRVTREMWELPFLELLGFRPQYHAAAEEVAGESFLISHRDQAGDGRFPLHLVGWTEDLSLRAHRRQSAYALMQGYLLRSEALWGLISNGRALWVLRGTPGRAHGTYLAWDLETMMDAGKYDDFVALYRLCHRSRFALTREQAANGILEQYVERAAEEGDRIREGLRGSVEKALVAFGNGFLRHPANQGLRTLLAEGRWDAAGYYQELLRLIYRLLFLLVAEDRDLLLPKAADSARVVYEEAYALGRYRRMVERPPAFYLLDEEDWWEGLKELFTLWGQEEWAERLGVQALNGGLFGPDTCPHLDEPGVRLQNRAVYDALRALSLFMESDGRQHRVNYAVLDVEELGSVYESLLDYSPRVTLDAPEPFRLEIGNERKATGSYYTRPELVQQLIQSALEPVLRMRLAEAGPEASAQEAALLQLRVCDPAAGSGHFVLAAGRRIAKELARVRSGDAEPAPDLVRQAMRDVVRHCLYAVEKNPLAVDLCKVALWIEGHAPGLPLSFLDHRVRCGDSLVGVLDLTVLQQGIPDGAYVAKAGDDKATVKAIKARNRRERVKRQIQFETVPEATWQQHLVAQRRQWDAMPEDTAVAVREKEQAFHALEASPDHRQLELEANLWTGAFFASVRPDTADIVPTTMAVWMQPEGPTAPRMAQAAGDWAEQFRFFHWPLAFPEVFQGPDPGFDVVLTNPPWERPKLQQEEWFRGRDAMVVQAPNKAARERAIQALETQNPPLFAAYRAALATAKAAGNFLRQSGRFPLAAVGDINLFAVFAELAWNLLRATGRAGLVVPTGLVTDYTYRHFFAHLMASQGLASLYDFENRKRLFPAVHSRCKFSLLTLSRSPVEQPRLAFFGTDVRDLQDPRRIITLSTRDLATFNPNTRTCPVFRSRADAELAAKLYRAAPILKNEETGESPWQVEFLSMFHMSNDSSLFYMEPGPDRVPLYEAKMFHQFDHRWATYEEDGRVRELTEDEKADPHRTIRPRYWVERGEIEARIPEWWREGWLLVFRNITNATAQRTLIASIIPKVGLGNSASALLMSAEVSRWFFLLLANFNSIVLDVAATVKVGGSNLNLFIVKQLPFLSLDQYGEKDMLIINDIVFRLVLNSWDIVRAFGANGPPYAFVPEIRSYLRARLDAYYAHLYGLSRDELRYILDPQSVMGPDYPSETFRVLKERELKQFGEYRTARLVLEAYDQLAVERFGAKRARPTA